MLRVRLLVFLLFEPEELTTIVKYLVYQMELTRCLMLKLPGQLSPSS
ncbi:protein of unknown function [Limnospira indica PCC 8005]|uniref:Uncharacterized protein n=1 Tax=Limnospira indica PCC 8005 TaxID=376219 RepID=A0A9P1KGN9_9CYAN|nr:protein of unknown function [Limnospira indica PCC 8005]